MGIQVELPTLVKRRLMSLAETPTKEGGSKEIDHDSWQWGAFGNLTIGDPLSHPTRLNADCGAGGDAATLADSSPDGSSKHLISPSPTGSSPLSPSSPRSATSPPFGGGCVDPFRGSVTQHKRLKKKRDGKDLNSMSFAACNGELRPSRWDSGRWSGGANSFDDGTSVKTPRGSSACKCAAGLTADVAVVCCCPFSLLHLLAIAFVKVSTAVVSPTLTKIKRKVAARRKRAAVYEEDEDSIPASSCPPSRCRSYEEGAVQTWAPALAFGDQKWRDYFDSPDVGVWSSEELLKGKS